MKLLPEKVGGENISIFSDSTPLGSGPEFKYPTNVTHQIWFVYFCNGAFSFTRYDNYQCFVYITKKKLNRAARSGLKNLQVLEMEIGPKSTFHRLKNKTHSTY